MTTTAFSGPIMVWGQNPILPDYNPDLGSSLFFAGAAIMDPRAPFTYLAAEAENQPDIGWFGFDNIKTLVVVPATSTTGAIVASANPTGPTLALVSVNSAATGVYSTSAFTRSDTGVADAGPLVALDSFASITASAVAGVMTITVNGGMPISSGMVLLTSSTAVTGGGGVLGTVGNVFVISQLSTVGAFSTTGNGYTGTYQLSQPVSFTSGTVTLAYPNVLSCVVYNSPQSTSSLLWSPMAILGRAVSVFAAAAATYTTATVSGYDIYGYPMVETITLVANSAVNGRKAFRYIKSVVLSGGSADTTHAYRVDTTSIIGLPLRADSAGEVMAWAGASQVATTQNLTFSANGFLPADRTVPTAITGDVRGTIDLSNAGGINLVPATATNKYSIKQNILPTNVQNAFGLLGQPHFTNF